MPESENEMELGDRGREAPPVQHPDDQRPPPEDLMQMIIEAVARYMGERGRGNRGRMRGFRGIRGRGRGGRGQGGQPGHPGHQEAHHQDVDEAAEDQQPGPAAPIQDQGQNRGLQRGHGQRGGPGRGGYQRGNRPGRGNQQRGNRPDRSQGRRARGRKNWTSVQYFFRI